MRAILKREYSSFFKTPLGYVFCGLFLLITSIFFYFTSLAPAVNNLSRLFSNMLMAMTCLIPILTMRLFSEDRKSKVDQALLTAPVGIWGIVLGKFLAALGVFGTALAGTALYVAIIVLYGTPDPWNIIGNYLAILLVAIAFIAIGLFFSSLTENQLIAVLCSVAVLLSNYLTAFLSGVFSGSRLAFVLSALSLTQRYQGFSAGIFSLVDAVYYLSVAAVFLVLTVYVIEGQRCGKLSLRRRILRKDMVRRIQYCAFTAILLACIVLVNLILGQLSQRLNLKRNMNSIGEFTIGQATLELLAGLQEPVSIYVIDDELNFKGDLYGRKVAELLERYTAASPHVTATYIDPLKNPGFLNEYQGNTNINMGTLLFRTEKRTASVQFLDLFLLDEQTGYAYGSAAEQRISAAVKYVTDDQVIQAAYVAGHGESPLSGLEDIFATNNFDLRAVELKSQPIPKELDNLIISSPQQDYSPGEIAVLAEFLSRSGNSLYVFYSYLTPTLPRLEAFFESYGVAYDEMMILDAVNSVETPIQLFLLPGAHPINEKLSFAQKRLVAPALRGMNLLWEQRDGVTNRALLVTASDAYGKAINPQEAVGDLAKSREDVAGPFVAAVHSAWDEGGDLFFFGSSFLAYQEVTSQSVYLNRSFLQEVIAYGNPGTYLDISPVIFVNPQLAVDAHTGNMMLIGLIMIPAGIFLWGLVVYLRRRSR